ncbi:MAG TPA: hypothetical protein ENH31_07160 [Nitrospirae bacterium]|nr:hypothetical protein [Nitrospirota bacterium]HDK82336.1 hypothetical protein [Nitrospirota bacterium]
MNTFIVRVYRCEKDNPPKLVGVVEEVGIRGQRAFTGLDELWDIIGTLKGRDTEKRITAGDRNAAEKA